MAKFGTNESGAIWWPNLELMLVEPPGGQMLNSYTWNQVDHYLAGEITQVIDSIPWVRCASGNVFLFCLKVLHFIGVHYLYFVVN